VPPSALPTVPHSARDSVARFAIGSGVIAAALALAGLVAFVVGGADTVPLAAAGVLLFTMGAVACGLADGGERHRGRAALQALIELGRELENVGPGGDLAVMLAQHGRVRLGFKQVVVLTRARDRWKGAAATRAGGATATGPVKIGPLAERIWRTGSPRLVPSLAGDRVLDALLPSARNVVVVPLVADGEPLGVVLAE
jgi:hypothetical protein